MQTVKLYPGDTAFINGAEIAVDRTVTLHSSATIDRVPAPGLVDLPETDLRIPGWEPGPDDLPPGPALPLRQRLHPRV